MNAKIVFTIAVAFCAMQQPANAAVDIPGMVNNMLGALTSTVQGLITQLNDATTKVISNINAQLKQQEQDIVNYVKSKFNDLDTDAADIKACFQNLSNVFTDVEAKAQSDEQSFLIKEGIALLPLIGKLNATFNELVADGKADISQGTVCSQQSGINSVVCFGSLISTITQQTAQVKGEVDVEIPLVKTDVQKVLTDGATFAKQVLNDTSAILTKAGDDTISCIQNAIAAKAAAAAAAADAAANSTSTSS